MASTAAVQDGWMARAALRSAAWAEKWFPDAYVFAVLGVVIVALAAMGFGSTPQATASASSDTESKAETRPLKPGQGRNTSFLAHPASKALSVSLPPPVRST